MIAAGTVLSLSVNVRATEWVPAAMLAMGRDGTLVRMLATGKTPAIRLPQPPTMLILIRLERAPAWGWKPADPWGILHPLSLWGPTPAMVAILPVKIFGGS